MPAIIESKLLQAGLLSQVCVIGSGLPNAMAICTLSEPIKVKNTDQQKQQLLELLQQTNSQLEHHERISKMIVLEEEWTTANGLLTPTLKIKRKVVDSSFGEKYIPWSMQEEAIIWG